MNQVGRVLYYPRQISLKCGLVNSCHSSQIEMEHIHEIINTQLIRFIINTTDTLQMFQHLLNQTVAPFQGSRFQFCSECVSTQYGNYFCNILFSYVRISEASTKPAEGTENTSKSDTHSSAVTQTGLSQTSQGRPSAQLLVIVLNHQIKSTDSPQSRFCCSKTPFRLHAGVGRCDLHTTASLLRFILVQSQLCVPIIAQCCNVIYSN